MITLKEYMDLQIEAFHEWIWCFGVDTGINLRNHFNEDELMHIWISRYAKDFHDEWEGKVESGHSNYS